MANSADPIKETPCSLAGRVYTAWKLFYSSFFQIYLFILFGGGGGSFLCDSLNQTLAQQEVPSNLNFALGYAIQFKPCLVICIYHIVKCF